MRSCPDCESRSINASAILAASLQSPSYCSSCGSELVSPLRGDAVIFAAALVGISFGFYFSSYAVGILTTIVASCSVLLAPLKARDDDAIAFRNKLREFNDR